jgi:hypothetical protein
MNRAIILSQLLALQQRNPENGPIDLLPQSYGLFSHAFDFFVCVAANDFDVKVDGKEPFY